MSETYHVWPLAPEQLVQAFPLVKAIEPDMTLERWLVYAGAFLQHREGQAARKILTVQCDKGYIHGLAFCRCKPDLRLGCILEVENFVSLDLTGGKRAGRALLKATEQQARDWGCGYVRLSLLDDETRHHPVTATIRSSGYRQEPDRLAKQLVAAG
jgi:GNAT superfamily N-acetyltransferase